MSEVILRKQGASQLFGGRKQTIETSAPIMYLTRSSPASTTQPRSTTTFNTVPTTDSESDTDYSSDEETIIASNCSRQSSATGGVSEGVLKLQSRGTHVPRLSFLASSATPSGHNIS